MVPSGLCNTEAGCWFPYLEIYACLSAHDIYSQPLQLQTSLHCVCVYSAALRLPHILFTPWQSSTRLLFHYPIWRYMRAFRHSKLLKACTAANKFALLTSAYIWPGGHIYCSRLGRARMLLVYCAAISYIPECECAFRHMTSIRSRCNCKQVCIACVFSYMQFRFPHSGMGYCGGANIFALLSASAYICTSKMLCDESRGFYF